MTTQKQQELCLKMIKRPAVNSERYQKIYKENVLSLVDQYKMNE